MKNSLEYATGWSGPRLVGKEKFDHPHIKRISHTRYPYLRQGRPRENSEICTAGNSGNFAVIARVVAEKPKTARQKAKTILYAKSYGWVK